MKKVMVVVVAAVLAVVCACVVATGVASAQAGVQTRGALSVVAQRLAAQAVVPADYSWYDAETTTFTFTNDGSGKSVANKLSGLSNIVNGTAPGIDADDFTGKTVRVSEDVLAVNFNGYEWTPIGTVGHPFNGTFDAQDREISNFTITETSCNAGFFGVTGRNSVLRNIVVANGTRGGVTIGSQDAPYKAGIVQCVGSLVGNCNGRIENCSSNMSVTVYNDTPVTDDLMRIVDSVGGLAGRCRGSIEGSSYAGAVSISSASNTDNDDDQGYLIMQCIGGVVGFFGDIDAPGSTKATISDTVNMGSVKVSTTGYASGDRFGETVVSQAGYVGGVAGYTTGSVVDCGNEGSIDTSYRMTTIIYGTNIGAAGSYIGGVVGCLRGDIVKGMSGMVEGAYDAGTGASDNPVSVTRCYNTGSVFGNHAVGGVVGVTGWHSSVVACYCDIPVGSADPSSEDYLLQVGGVKAARWNKPMGGGIVGKSYGAIAYCYNRSRVWSTTDGGYYIAGIAGVMFRGTSVEGYEAPIPETWGCYNTGYAQSGLRAASIAGQNEGYIHDCYALHETSYHAAGDAEKLVFSDYATTVRSDFIEVNDLKSSAGVASLNFMAASEGWNNFFVPAADTSVNGAFPILSWQDAGDKTNLSTASARIVASLASDADFNGIEAVPTLSVLYDDDGLESTPPVNLVQNADFRVVPQAGAVSSTLAVDRITGTRPYKATIEGMGRYDGAPTVEVAYGIVVGDLSTCTFVVKERIYTGQPIVLDESDVTLLGVTGNVVPSENYDFVVNGGVACVNRGTYPLTATVSGNSEGSDYVGSVTARAFTISPADLHTDCVITGVTGSGQRYGADELDTMTFTYTGQAIRPTVDSVTYQPADGSPLVTLVEGESATTMNADYTVSYLSDGDYVNVTTGEGGSPLNITVQSCWPDTIGSFHNYVTLLFDIVPADIASADITVPDQAHTGEPRGMAVLEFNGDVLVEGVDYQIEYANNVGVGTATATITGIGNFTGETKRSYQILDKEPVDLASVAKMQPISDKGWTGEALQPEVEVSLVSDGSVLRQGVDYVLTYADNVDAGTARVIAVGCGAYSGNLTGSFNIVSHELSFAVGFGKLPDGRYTNDYLDSVRFIMNSSTTSKPVFERGLGALVSIQVVRSTAFNRTCNLTGISIVGDKTGKSYDAIDLKVSNDTSTSGVNNLTCTFIMPDEDVTVTGITYQVAAKSLQSCTYTADDTTYTGSAVVPENIEVTDGSKKLVRGVDYEVASYTYVHNDVEAGPASITLVGQGDYTGTLDVEFAILPRGELKIAADNVNAVYDGGAHGVSAAANIPSAKVRYGTAADDCTLEESPVFTDVGTYVVYFEVVSPGDFAAGSATVSISQRPVVVSAQPASKQYGGDDPVFTALVDGVLAGDGNCIAYEVSRPRAGVDEGVGVYADAIVCTGEASQGNYSVTFASADFEVKVIDSLRLSAEDVTVDYDGAAHGLAGVRVSVPGAAVSYGLSPDTCELAESPVFTDAGSYTVYFSASLAGYESASGQANVVISPATATLTASGASKTYGDDNPAPEDLSATLSGFHGSDQLVAGVDYTVLVVGVSADAPVGTYPGAVRVSLNREVPNYRIQLVSGDLVVNQRSFATAVVSTLLDRVYTGEAITPVPDVTFDGRRMANGTDFTVAYFDGQNRPTTPVDPGTYTVLVQGIGNYTGQADQTTSFTINAPEPEPPHEHVWDEGVVTTAPSCTQPGERTYTCTGCGETRTEAVAALGHDWNEGALTLAPTCTQPGERTITCKNDSSHTRTDSIAAIGHDWDEGVVTLEPTATTDGVRTFTCKNDLSHTRMEAIAATGEDPEPVVEKKTMHRLYNPWTGEHFYTERADERDALVPLGWNYEGIGWTAPSTSNTPVYRLYNPYAEGGDHHYTTSVEERDYLASVGWSAEGVGWYSDDALGVPLYRQYNPYAESGSHNYTANREENDYLVSIGWKEEGVGWYGVKI